MFFPLAPKNIAIVDDVPDMKKVVRSATTAKISNWIESLLLGYNTDIMNNFSEIFLGKTVIVVVHRLIREQI